MTPDELRSLPKGQFIVMKTGQHPMRTRLKLFLDWGITFEEAYEVPKKQIGQVRYANKTMLKQAVAEHYPRMEEPDHAGLSRQRRSIRQKGEEDGSV